MFQMIISVRESQSFTQFQNLLCHFLNGKIGTVDQDCILCLFQWCNLTVHIPLIPGNDLSFNLIQITVHIFFTQFQISAVCSCPGAGCQIDLHIRIRKNIGSDISSIHYHIFFLRQISLKAEQLLSHFRNRRTDGCHLSDLFLPK